MIACSFFSVEDADGDIIRCRWASSSLGECGGVCNAFPATLDKVKIVIQTLSIVYFKIKESNK